MALVERGKIQDGGIVLAKPLTLPDGTEVVVRIESLEAAEQTGTHWKDEDFVRLPFFGMWADREDMRDSGAWVRREREQWHKRAERKD